MKLFLCLKCQDVKKLGIENTICNCGESGGRYMEDKINAVYWGPCTLIGFSNPSLLKALHNIPEEGMGERFEAFLIPKKCDTAKQIQPGE